MSSTDAYKVSREPFYQSQGNEIELYEAAYAARLPVMVKGPTGCGKSRFVEYMAWKLGKPLITVACNEDMTAADLVGRFLLDASGTRWQDGPLTLAARIGAICYLDEIVEARQDTLVVIHPLTDHRRTLPIDKKGELVAAHPDFQLVISYNPGYQSLMKDLKQSTKQRFTAFQFDYPEAALEAKIVATEAAVDGEMAAKLVEVAAGRPPPQGPRPRRRHLDAPDRLRGDADRPRRDAGRRLQDGDGAPDHRRRRRDRHAGSRDQRRVRVRRAWPFPASAPLPTPASG